MLLDAEFVFFCKEMLCNLICKFTPLVLNQLLVTFHVADGNNQTTPLLRTGEPFHFIHNVVFSVRFFSVLLHLLMSNIATCLI